VVFYGAPYAPNLRTADLFVRPATLTGCLATTAPAGLSRSGLPVGLQIVGPYLEDATPIGFAQLLAGEIGGFQQPKGYDGIAENNALR
jgi:Asp-tRNA(Asn)/Glu-tRNA(Gln) amidotransferase A subunit family amidase